MKGLNVSVFLFILPADLILGIFLLQHRPPLTTDFTTTSSRSDKKKRKRRGHQLILLLYFHFYGPIEVCFHTCKYGFIRPFVYLDHYQLTKFLLKD